MKHAAIYVRVSTDEQRKKGLSVDNQIEALVEYCKEQNYYYKVYNDAGVSGAITYRKRPALVSLINDCKENKVDIILFTRIDRFFRSLKDYYLVMEMINEVPWNAIWQDYRVDTAQGRFNINIALSMAQMESDIDSERIRSVLDFKREQGQYVGQPPFGYKRVNGYLVKDEKTRSIVERIFDVYLQTFSVAKTAAQFDRSEFFLSENRVKRMFKNPAYCGRAQLGTCEPYITEEQFQLIQEVRKRNTRKPKEHHVYIFSGLCKCGVCGHRLHCCYTQPGGKGTDKFKEYFCRKQSAAIEHQYGVSLSERKLERYMLCELESIINNAMYKADTEDIDEALEDYEKKKNRINSKLERIKFLFTEGDLTIEEYKQKKEALLHELGTPPEATKRPNIVLPNNWKEIYADLSEDGKKAFWGSIIKEIIIDKGHDPVVRFL